MHHQEAGHLVHGDDDPDEDQRSVEHIGRQGCQGDAEQPDADHGDEQDVYKRQGLCLPSREKECKIRADSVLFLPKRLGAKRNRGQLNEAYFSSGR